MGYEDLDDDAKAWVDALESDLRYVADMAPMEIKVEDMNWFDQFQGPYGYLEINHIGLWKAWSSEDGLFIEDFILQNNKTGKSQGFIGSKNYLIDCLSNVKLHKELIKIAFTNKLKTFRIHRE